MNELEACLWKLRIGARRKPRIDDIAWNDDGFHPLSARTSDISSDKPLLCSHQTQDCPMLPVVTKRADDCLCFDPHPRG
jgi:hypothetical protein